MIVVDHASALIDQPVALELRGYAAGQPVTLTASMDFADGSRWQSHATFVTDESGCVDLTRQAPVSGTYEDVAAMGFIWSAERQPGGDVHPFPAGIVMQPWLVELEARASDGTTSRLTLERRGAGIGVTREPIRRDGIVGTLFLPPNPGPHPAVMVLSGGTGGLSEGRRPFSPPMAMPRSPSVTSVSRACLAVSSTSRSSTSSGRSAGCALSPGLATASSRCRAPHAAASSRCSSAPRRSLR